MKLKFTKYRKFYYAFSGVLFLASLFCIVFFGFQPGIEFAGGSVLEAEYPEERPSLEEITRKLEEAGFREVSVQPLGEEGVLVRTEDVGEETHREIMGVLEGAEAKEFESIGPAVGDELRNMSIVAILVASLLVVLYIIISFREEDGSVSSTKYGIIATGIAFFHDVFIVLGAFALLGHFYGAQLTIPIAVALLTTLGYSINDTVVIFDRIRENLRKNKKEEDLQVIVDRSLNNTIGRSIGTSFTTLLVLFSLLLFGGDVLFYFVLALILGVVLGTYSSIFLAGSLVLDWNKLTESKK